MAQSVQCDMLVLGSGAAGTSLVWPMAHAGERAAVVAR
jgi:succinate dehydrogenase/fumarate reductase flavoprotein subunit